MRGGGKPASTGRNRCDRPSRSFPLPGAAAGGAAALLFAAAVFFGGAGAPLSVATAVATDDCSMLTQEPSRRRGHTGSQPLSNAKRTPQNVTAACNARRHIAGNFYIAAEASVEWDVHSDFPTALRSGYCIEHTHDSGGVSEWCNESDAAASRTESRFKPCHLDDQGGATCGEGTSEFRVKLTTSCDVELPWSSTASCSF